MELVLAAVALTISVIAAVSSVMMFLNRQDHGDIQSKLRTVELELADLVDRLSIWQRRDAARQRRNVVGDAADIVGGSVADQHPSGGGRNGKDGLRAAARARGLIR